jgi:hypothetical protein
MEPGSDDRDRLHPNGSSPPKTDADVAPLIQKVGAPSIAQIEKLIGELHEARNLSRIREGANSARDCSLYKIYNLQDTFHFALILEAPRPAARQNDGPLIRTSLPHRLCSDRVTGVPLPKAHQTPPDQRRRHVAHGPRCPCLHASPVEGSRAKHPVAKGGPITPCEGRCRRCQQATRTRVAL